MENKHNKKSIGYQLETFRYAFKGIQWFFSSEFKSRIHSVCALAAIVLGIIVKLSHTDWILVAIAIGLVFITEIINTGIELMVDELVKEQNTPAGRIKDLSAGAVLIAALTALTIGIIVFVPEIVEL